MKKTIILILTLVSITGLVIQTGCTTTEANTVDPAVLAKHQADRVLDAQPADPVGIIELMTKLAGDSPDPTRASSDPVEVALLGQVGTAHADATIFTEGEAAFTMVDPSYEPASEAADHDHGGEAHEDHEGHDDDAGHEEDGHDDDKATEVVAATKSTHKADCPCPFCSSSKETPPQAIVTFVGEDGEPVAISAKQLFGLSGDELVVVTGTAKLSVGQLLVTADKIYVRK